MNCRNYIIRNYIIKKFNKWANTFGQGKMITLFLTNVERIKCVLSCLFQTVTC